MRGERKRERKREERSERHFGPWQQRHHANQISPTGKTPELVVEQGEIGRHHRRKILSKIFSFSLSCSPHSPYFDLHHTALSIRNHLGDNTVVLLESGLRLRSRNIPLLSYLRLEE